MSTTPAWRIDPDPATQEEGRLACIAYYAEHPNEDVPFPANPYLETETAQWKGYNAGWNLTHPW